MVSKSVAEFLAAKQAARDAVATSKPGALDRVEDELRQLAAGGATLADMVEYLHLNHQIKRDVSSLSRWLLSRGIGSRGRQVEMPVKRRQAKAAPPAKAEATSSAPADLAGTGSTLVISMSTGPGAAQAPDDSDSGTESPAERAKRQVEAQRQALNARKSSTLTAAQQFAHLHEANRQQGEALASKES